MTRTLTPQPSRPTLRLFCAAVMLVFAAIAGKAAQAQTTMQIVKVSGGLCLANSGGNLIQTTCAAPGTASQVAVSDNIHNQYSVGGQCMVATTYANNAPIALQACGSNTVNQFTGGTVNGNGIIKTSIPHPAFCVTPAGGSAAPGVTMVLYTCSGNPDQSFNYSFHTPAAPSAATAPALAIKPGAPGLNISNQFVGQNGSALLPLSLDGNGGLHDARGNLLPAAGTHNAFLGRIVAQGGGNLVGPSGGTIVAQGGGNYTININGTLVTVLGYTSSFTGILVDSQGRPYSIVAAGGGNLILYNPSGQIVAQGGGNIILNGGSTIVAQGGGNIVAQGGGNMRAVQTAYAAVLSHLMTDNGAAIISQDGNGFTHIDQIGLTRLIGENSSGLSAATQTLSPSNPSLISEGLNHYTVNSVASSGPSLRWVNRQQGAAGPQCLALRGAQWANGNALVQSNCLANEPTQKYVQTSDLLLHIGGTSTGYCVATQSTVQGSPIIAAKCNASDPNQQFAMGTFAQTSVHDFLARGNALCIGVSGGSSAANTPLVLAPCTRSGADNQAWTSQSNP